jgi:hypothetical protein
LADIIDKEQTEITRITGRDEQYPVDSVSEDGINKLWVKATAVPEALGNLFFLHAQNNGSIDLNVNGSGTPVEFTINAEANFDLICEGLSFEIFASGIKVDKFLSLNQPLSNGIIVEVKSFDQVFQFLPIQTTQEFDSHFAWGSGRSFDLIFASGNDSLVTRYGQENPFVIKKQGTYTNDDYIKVIIQDNLSQVNAIKFLAVGARD